jgi:molybdenum cofactor cytidylyltransferase
MICAVILAAGISRRMGRPKMLLEWGEKTVLGQVISVLEECGLDEILIVTGGAHQAVERLVEGKHVRTVFNPQFQENEMLESLKVGLRNLPEQTQAALIVLGDQPQIEAQVVEIILQAYRQKDSVLIVPSYRMKRGHPWLVDRSLWDEILEIEEPHNLRDFLDLHHQQIEYLVVETDTILRDLDTPADYAREKPGG